MIFPDTPRDLLYQSARCFLSSEVDVSGLMVTCTVCDSTDGGMAENLQGQQGQLELG